LRGGQCGLGIGLLIDGKTAGRLLLLAEQSGETSDAGRGTLVVLPDSAFFDFSWGRA
jgi:hypothetical protein